MGQIRTNIDDECYTRDRANGTAIRAKQRGSGILPHVAGLYPGHYHFLWYRRKGGFADGQEEAGEGVVDEELHRPCKRKRVKRTDRPVPDRKWVHKEFRREVVTLQLLWQECKVLYPDGYKLTQLYELYLGLYS